MNAIITEKRHNTNPNFLSILQYYSNLQLTTDFTCVNFTLLRNFPVANLSPYIPIKIYDWYSPGKKVEHIFSIIDLLIRNVSLYEIERH